MWWYVWMLLPVAIVLWLLYEWLEHTWVQYTTTTVECRQMQINKEFRICLMSDLHNNRKNLNKLTEHIRLFSPEVILLAGDLVDKHKTENIHAKQFLEALEQLQIPVFYTAGNHELSFFEKHPEEWKVYLESLPKQVMFLDNEALSLSAYPEICISGLSLSRAFYKKGGLYNNKEEFPKLSVPEHKFHILIAHHPEYADFYEKYKADLIVSGHLHGGLLRLPFIGGVVSPRLRLPDFDAGLKKLQNGSLLFISRGLGSHTIPLRFFNRVEVNFLVLKGTKE